jgi:hypothetical protein
MISGLTAHNPKDVMPYLSKKHVDRLFVWVNTMNTCLRLDRVFIFLIIIPLAYFLMAEALFRWWPIKSHP